MVLFLYQKNHSALKSEKKCNFGKSHCLPQGLKSGYNQSLFEKFWTECPEKTYLLFHYFTIFSPLAYLACLPVWTSFSLIWKWNSPGHQTSCHWICDVYCSMIALCWSGRSPTSLTFYPLFVFVRPAMGNSNRKETERNFCRGFLLHCWLVISTTVTLPILWYYTSFFFDCRHISIEKRILCSTYCSIENASKFIKFLWNTLVRFLFRSS